MHLFYSPNVDHPEHTLEGDEGMHAVRVLRVRCGDAVALTDGRGNMYLGEVVDTGRSGCRITITDCTEQYGRRPYGLTMAVAPTKNTDRYEWFLEKATEIGCDRFIPLYSSRSERKVLRPDRCGRVITSAVKQSFSAYHPVLEEGMMFPDIVKRQFDGGKYIAHCDPAFERVHLADAVRPGDDNLVLIGPEGDFSPEEIEAAIAAGFIGVSLGTSRLRTETAAVTAVSITAVANR